MKIIGYTYEADTHCVSCAVKRFAEVPHKGKELDEHFIPMRAEDGEGNEIHPMFSTDEQIEQPFCGTCHQSIE